MEKKYAVISGVHLKIVLGYTKTLHQAKLLASKYEKTYGRDKWKEKAEIYRAKDVEIITDSKGRKHAIIKTNVPIKWRWKTYQKKWVAEDDCGNEIHKNFISLREKA